MGTKLISGIIMLLLFALSNAPVKGQVTYFPRPGKQDVSGLYIKKVEITDNYTLIDFYYQPEDETMICLNKTFYISPARIIDPHFMIMAENISICPERIRVSSDNIYYEFRAWFPKLEEDIRIIDIIEDKRDRKGFNLYSVPVINGQERPFPDSLKIKSRKDLEEILLSDSTEPDLLEGIWKVELQRLHYRDKAVLNKHEEKKVSEWLLIKEEQMIMCYDSEGRSVESSFNKVTGRNNYFFRKYLRKINMETSAYIILKNDNEFELSFIVPEKIARYEFFGVFFPNDELVYKYKFTRAFPADRPLQK